MNNWGDEGGQEGHLSRMRRESLIKRPRKNKNPGSRTNRCQGYRQRRNFPSPRSSSEYLTAGLMEAGVLIFRLD